MSLHLPKQSPSDLISHLPGHILFSLARNESATREFRKAAVVLLLEKEFPQVNHVDLADILAEVKKDKEALGEVESIVEAAIEQEIPKSPAVFSASVTTQTLQQPEIVRNADALSDDALGESEPEPAVMSPAVAAATTELVNSILESKVPEESFLRDGSD